MANIPENRKLDLLSEKEIDELTPEDILKLIPYELEKWNTLQMSPQNVIMDIFKMNNQMMALSAFLVQKGLATEEEINILFRKETYKNLREIRTTHQGEILKNKLLQGVHFQIPEDIAGGSGL